MGIPGYFREILQYYHNTHDSKKNVDFDYFLMDYNGIIYKILPKLLKLVKYNPEFKKHFEDKLITEVIKYTQRLVCDVIQPTEILYIAIDGPAPRAKMIQQRSRRYKGYQKNILVKNIKEKYYH